jgi:trimeric autotransporter adhesin
MALILKDRVKESSSSSGTGNITLGGAFPGYQTFNAAIATGSTVYYTIHNLAAGFDTEWEVGLGTFTSPATLVRTTVLSSSTGSAVNFTAGTNGLEVFITQPAEEAVYINNATGKVEANGNGANTISFTNINASNVVMVSGTISTNAANATDITNKQYVDGLVLSGTHFHEPVLVEEDVNLVAVYNQPNGAGNGVGATLTNNAANAALVVDGVSVSNTARILVYAQSNAVQNGVYTVTNPGNASAQWVLTRSTDTDTYGLASSTELSEGSTFFVTSGNTGAGRTYTCNTQGTITFGSTNITFAQISSAQIYSAGTGLNLSNLTFSIANTTVVSGLYGDSANVSVIEVNAQGQLTSAANSAINVSNITVGTLSNDRTTASASNGANTIVLRDANGSFNANVVTATTVNATTGNFTNITANAVGLTDINASNITSGTISNARTTGATANGASTIVLRDANGAFSAGNVTAANFIGAGTTITSINASNISSGTIANARTTADSANGASTIVARDSSGSFTANVGTFTSISGNGVSLSAINASNITSGTIANARTTAATANGASTIVLRGASGEFAAGAITGASFSGDGSSITAINASSISSGTIANARTTATTANGASTIVVRDANGSFAGNVITGTTFSGSGASLTSIPNSATTAASANGASTIVARDANGSFTANVGTFTTVSGAGGSLSGINASNLASGTAPVARLAATGTPSASTFLRGDSSWTAVPSPNNGTLTMNVSGTGLSGSATFTADQAGASTFTVASNASSANGASTLVARDASGNFTANVGTFTTVAGTLSTAAQTNITSVGSLGSTQISSLGVGTAASGTGGEIRATNNITAFFSDERLKTKTGDIKNALDKVCQIETLLYHANETAVALGYDASIQEVGVTAQSVQKVQPEIVVPAPIDDKYLTVRYEKLVPLLIEAIKELKAEIDALKGK